MAIAVGARSAERDLYSERSGQVAAFSRYRGHDGPRVPPASLALVITLFIRSVVPLVLTGCQHSMRRS